MRSPALLLLALLLCPVARANDNRTFSDFNVTIRGKVACRETRTPVASHITILADEPQPVQLSSQPDGEFEAVLSSVNSFAVRVEAEGYEVSETRYFVPVRKDTAFFIEVLLDPLFTMTFSGNILNAKTNKPIQAELDLYRNSDIIKEDIQIAEHGQYKEVLTKQGWYIIEVTAPGYLMLTDTLLFANERRKSLHKDYELTPIEVGLNMVIENVNFYFGNTSLKPESADALSKIVNLLKANPGISIEIAGYTDDEGDADYNLQLSQGRAQAVVDHIAGQGIDPTRLIAKGYGEEKPIDTTNTKAGKARNRRVEFTVVDH